MFLNRLALVLGRNNSLPQNHNAALGLVHDLVLLLGDPLGVVRLLHEADEFTKGRLVGKGQLGNGVVVKVGLAAPRDLGRGSRVALRLALALLHR